MSSRSHWMLLGGEHHRLDAPCDLAGHAPARSERRWRTVGPGGHCRPGADVSMPPVPNVILACPAVTQPCPPTTLAGRRRAPHRRRWECRRGTEHARRTDDRGRSHGCRAAVHPRSTRA
jgi:hypothetical protein